MILKLGMQHQGLKFYKVYMNKNIIMSSFKSSRDIQRKRVGQTAVSDNQSSSVTLNELAKKDRKIYCNFEFQRRSHTMTDINLNRAHINKLFRIYESKPIMFSDFSEYFG